MNSAESKAHYKQRIFRLLGDSEQEPIQSGDKFWNCFWDEPQSAQDVYNLLTINDLKLIRDTNKPNYLNWIRTLVIKLINLTHEIKKTPGNAQYKQILNCIRYLTKILPSLFEKPEMASDINHIFWNLAYNNIETISSAGSLPSTVSNPNSTRININQSVSTSPNSQDVNVGITNTKTLGDELIHCLVDLLFLRGFSLDKNGPEGVDYKIWEVGIGLNGKYSNPNPQLDSNRLEVLRLILVLSSQGLYTSPQQVVSKGSRFLTILVATLSKLKALTLICSLLNLVCRSCNSNEELNGLIYQTHKYQNLRKNFITISLNLLTLMIVYPIPQSDVGFIYKLNILQQNEKIHNLVRSYLARLHKENELNFIFNSIISFIKNPMEKSIEMELNPLNMFKSNFSQNDAESTSTLTDQNSLIPTNLSNWNLELVIFLWELIQSNKNFKNFIINKKIHDFTIILFFYLKYYKSNPRYNTNLIRIISYLLIYLTSNDLVNSNLIIPINQDFYHNQLPNFFKLNNIHSNQLSNLTYRDFIIIQIVNTINIDCVQDPSKFNSIITPIFFNLLYNLIPVQKITDQNQIIHYKNKNSLSYQSSLSIINLISKLSNSPSFLRNQLKLDLLSLIIRSLTHSCIRYQSESRALIYNVVKHEDVFRKLLTTIETLQSEEEEEEPEQQLEDTEDDEDRLEGEDDYFQSGTDNHNQSQSPSESIEFEESLRPKPPTGMSSKAKGKLPIDAPLSKTWTGYKSLSTLIKFIEFIQSEIPNLNKSTKLEIMEYLIKIENIKNFETKILKFSSYEFTNKTNFENLKFIWSSLSLGWYESILWGNIFYQNSYQFNKDLNLTSTWFNKRNSGLSNLKEVASNWGFNWNKSETTTPEIEDFEFDQSILQINIWNGTFIKLFKIQKPIMEKPLIDVNNLMKKLRLNSASSVTTLNTLDSRNDSLNSPNQLTPINSRQSFTPRNSIHINSRQNSFSNINEIR